MDQRPDRSVWIGFHDVILEFSRKYDKRNNTMLASRQTILGSCHAPFENEVSEHETRKWWLVSVDKYIWEMFLLLFARIVRLTLEASTGFFLYKSWYKGNNSHYTVADRAADVVSSCIGSFRYW